MKQFVSYSKNCMNAYKKSRVGALLYNIFAGSGMWIIDLDSFLGPSN